MSTLLNDLPENKPNNIMMNISDEKQISNSMTPDKNEQKISLDQETINQLISGLQNASGSTRLPSRDIPQTTESIVNDPKTIANHIDEEPLLKSFAKKDYIDEYVDKDEIKTSYITKNKIKTQIDSMYDELNGPLLIAILYFIFQLPFFKKFILTYIPFLFNDDYNYNLYGYIFVSIFFSMIFYLIMAILKQFDKF
jgi:hypothetical protein